jgi:hypothetical protein
MIVVLAATAGCGDFLDEPYEPVQTMPQFPQGTRPEWGAGLFRYECVSHGDPACDGPPALSEYFPEFARSYALPRAVAVGSRFDVSYVAGSITAPSHSASAALLSNEAGVFYARRPGLVGLMGISTADTVLAWVHLQINEPAGIRLSGLERRQLEAGTAVPVSAYLVDSRGFALGGAVDFHWTVQGSRVLNLTVGGRNGPGWSLDDQAVLRAEQSGVARLTVTALDVELEVEIEVVAPAETPDAGVAP